MLLTIPPAHTYDRALLHLYSALIFFSILGCEDDRGAVVLTPAGITKRIAWDDKELAKEIAVKTLRKTEAASFHVVRIVTAENPHVHDRSDLSVFVLSGRVRMRLGAHTVEIEAGDVIDIPRGVPHWAENIADQPSEAYVIFMPPFNPKDYRATGAKH
jgi:mannose-6-phosphate isomerase-like protein (cupin superfamily)